MWARVARAVGLRTAAVLICVVLTAGYVSFDGSGSDLQPPRPSDSPPWVMGVTPVSGATGVSPDANIVITFSKAMNQASVASAFSTYPSVAGSFSWNAGSDVLTFDPTGPLSTGTKYAVVLDGNVAKDSTGLYLDGDGDGTHETGGAWVAKADCPSSLYARAATVLDSDIYLVGGRTGSGPAGTVNVYHPRLDTWGTLSPLSVPRSGLTAAVSGGKSTPWGDTTPPR